VTMDHGCQVNQRKLTYADRPDETYQPDALMKLAGAVMVTCLP
jgi:hypothetical protein